MKRILSLVLVLVLALGSVPFAFADDAKTAGETLQELGLAKGVDAEGNLNEEGMLTRAEMMVVISRLLGVEEEAMNYAIPSTSKDVEGHWAAKYIAYAEQVGKWSNGVGNDMFAPQGQVTNQMVAKFMLTALGYEANWETAVQDATALGLMEGVSGEATANITRGNVFKAALNTINTPSKDSDVKLGVSLGVLEPEAPVVVELEGTVDTVKAIANNLVEVVFEDDVDAAAAGNVANYAITERANTDNVVVINAVSVEAGDVVVLETEALKAGTAYTVTVAEEAVNFSGIAKDTDALEVKTVKGTDTGIVVVEFENALVDKATAEDIANYSIDKEGTVVKAELNSARTSVELTVEGLTTTTAKNLTVENVLSVDKVAMKKVTRVFFPKYDKFAPTFRLNTAQRYNNVTVIIDVVDENGIDEATAEDIANYTIEGLDVISAEAQKSDSDLSIYDQIKITTSEQTNGKNYALKINNLVDGSNAKNPMTKEVSISFRGSQADTVAPTVKKVTAITTTTIEVEFNENNNLDASTALNPANYELDKDDFQILEAKFEDDETDSKVIVLTTSTQPSKKANFKLTITNVTDEFNNTMSKTTRFFISTVEDTDKPVIDSWKATTSEKVQVVFANPVEKALAEDATNYSVNEGIGSPKSAELGSDRKTVTLTFDNLEAGVSYDLTVSNITNLYDVVMDEKEVTFIALREGVDNEAPTLDTYYMTSKNELRLIFSEDVKAAGTIVLEKAGSADITYSYSARLADKKTLVFTGAAFANTDYTVKSVTGVQDLAGNAYVYTSSDQLPITGSDETSTPELLSWAQTDLRTFVLYFDREVKVISANSPYRVFDKNNAGALVANASNPTFTLTRDSDDYTIVEMDTTAALADTFKGSIKVQELVTDLVGNAAKTENIELFGGLVDETAQNIVSVVPKYAQVIEVTYDEELLSAGSYTLKNITDDVTITATVTGFTSGDDVVTLNLSAAMDSDKIYELKQNTLARDRAKTPNKANDAGAFTFVGVETTAPATSVYGVEFVNGNEVVLYSTSGIAAGVTTASISASSSTVTPVATIVQLNPVAFNADRDETTITTNEETPFLKDVDYTVTLGTVSFTFEGIVEELEIDTNDYLIGYTDNDDYTFEIYSTAGVAFTSGTSSTTLVDPSGLVDDTELSGSGQYKIIVKNGSNVVYVTEFLTK